MRNGSWSAENEGGPLKKLRNDFSKAVKSDPEIICVQKYKTPWRDTFPDRAKNGRINKRHIFGKLIFVPSSQQICKFYVEKITFFSFAILKTRASRGQYKNVMMAICLAKIDSFFSMQTYDVGTFELGDRVDLAKWIPTEFGNLARALTRKWDAWK